MTQDLAESTDMIQQRLVVSADVTHTDMAQKGMAESTDMSQERVAGSNGMTRQDLTDPC